MYLEGIIDLFDNDVFKSPIVGIFITVYLFENL